MLGVRRIGFSFSHPLRSSPNGIRLTFSICGYTWIPVVEDGSINRSKSRHSSQIRMYGLGSYSDDCKAGGQTNLCYDRKNSKRTN